MRWGFFLQALGFKLFQKTFGGPSLGLESSWLKRYSGAGMERDEMSWGPVAGGRASRIRGEMGSGKEKWMFTLRAEKRNLGESSSLQGPIFGSGRIWSAESTCEGRVCSVMYMRPVPNPAPPPPHPTSGWAPYRFSVESEIRTSVFSWISASLILALVLPRFCILSPKASKCS